MSTSFEFTMGGEAVPVGTYKAEFVRVENFDSENLDYPPAIKLVFGILAGGYEGTEVTRIVSKKTGPKANLPKFATMLSGGPIASGEKFTLTNFYGAVGTVVMEETEGGGTRVSTFIRES